MNVGSRGAASETAIITGAGGGGIGTAIAARLARSGYRLFTLERTPEAKQRLVDFGHARPDDVFVGDVGDEKAIAKFADIVLSQTEHVKALIHNAARGVPVKPVWDVEYSEFFEDVSDILIGGFLLAKHFSRALKSHGESSIVYITSSAATRGARGRAVSYSAAKGGLHGLIKGLAVELGEFGITVNGVAPTQTITPRILKDGRRSLCEIEDLARKHIPLRRPANPEDIEGVVEFLCSKAARYITGEIINVDGGQSLSPTWTRVSSAQNSNT